MFRSNVNVGRGCVARQPVRQPNRPAPQLVNVAGKIERHYRFATPAQTSAYRQRLIDAGIIG